MTNQWHINILTLFPEIFPGPLDVSVIGKALNAGIWSYQTTQIRDYAIDNYNSVDDRPFGGGAGMVMRADILERALLAINNPGRKFCLSPRGRPLTQGLVREISATSPVTLLCGRYEGVDERFLQAYDIEEISVGDFVMAGGELPAMCLMEACIRLLPGVLGNDATPDEESFTDTQQPRLEYPQYTRPARWETADGRIFDVPDMLRSGDHKAIEYWRARESEALTTQRRPDLLEPESKQDNAKTHSDQKKSPFNT